MRNVNFKLGRGWNPAIVAGALCLALAFASGGSAQAQTVGAAYSFFGPETPVVLDGATVVGRVSLSAGTYLVTATAVIANEDSAKGGEVLCSLEGDAGGFLVDEVSSWLPLGPAPTGSESHVSWSATTTVNLGPGSGRVRAICENRSTIADTNLSVFSVRLIAVRLASERRRN